MSEYLITRNGAQAGPFDDADVRRRVESGDLRPEDLCWRKGMANWHPIAVVFGLDAPAADSPPPVPASRAASAAVELPLPALLFSLHGRLAPLPYFLCGLVLNVLSYVAFLAICLALPGGSDEAGSLILAGLLVGIPYFAMAGAAVVKRLHDMDRSGTDAIWYFLASLVPILNIVVGIALIVKSGTKGPNRYGPQTRVVVRRTGSPAA